MALCFTHLLEPASVGALTKTQQAQLREAGKRYDGNTLSARERFENDDEELVLCDLQIWQVEDDGRHVYDAYLYMVDSGTVFRKNTCDVVSEMIQFYFDHPADEALRNQLQQAHSDATASRRKPAARNKTSARNAATRTTAAKKSAAKTTAARVAPKPAVKPTATKKTATKKATPKKVAAKTTTTKKAAAKKTRRKPAA